MPLSLQTSRRLERRAPRWPPGRPAISAAARCVVRAANEGDLTFDTLVRATDPALRGDRGSTAARCASAPR